MNRSIIFSPGEYYHIYSRGVDKRNIFLNKRDYDRVVKLLYLANSDEGFIFSEVFGKKGQKDLDEKEMGSATINLAGEKVSGTLFLKLPLFITRESHKLF